jgi:hypothetical protein
VVQFHGATRHESPLFAVPWNGKSGAQNGPSVVDRAPGARGPRHSVTLATRNVPTHTNRSSKLSLRDPATRGDASLLQSDLSGQADSTRRQPDDPKPCKQSEDRDQHRRGDICPCQPRLTALIKKGGVQGLRSRTRI